MHSDAPVEEAEDNTPYEREVLSSDSNPFDSSLQVSMMNIPA